MQEEREICPDYGRLRYKMGLLKLNISKESLCNLYINKKMSSAKIGKISGWDPTTILNRLREFGIPIRPHKLAIKKKQLQALYTIKRLSWVEIGRILNCDVTTILDRLRKFRIPFRPNKPGIGREKLYNLYITKKLSSADIGKMLDCDNVTICSRLREFGIPIRSKEELIKACLRRRIPSSLEVKFQNIINKHNLPYKYVGDGKFFIESLNPDFINTNSEKVAIEVYARYYKRRNKISIKEWKKERTQVFKSYGWQVIYFDETGVNEKNVLKVLRTREVG